MDLLVEMIKATPQRLSVPKEKNRANSMEL